MYLTKIRLSAISTLLLTILVKHGDTFSLANMLEALFGKNPGEDAVVSKSSYVELFPQTRRHWNEYDDLYEDSNEFHPPRDEYHPPGYFTPRDDYYSSRDELQPHKDDFHPSKEDKSDNDLPKISVVYNNIFLMSAPDNHEDHELPHQQNPNNQDNSFDYSKCLNPANWATCASHVTGFGNKEYKKPDSPNVLRAVLDFLGNKSGTNIENEQRSPPIEPTDRKTNATETRKNAESRNITKLEKPTGRDLNSRNISAKVEESKSPLTTVKQKARITQDNATHILKTSSLGRNTTSGSPIRSYNSTAHLSRGDKDEKDKTD
ncbi:hypothetical protein WA026_018201 [Henosepilachna vigintioctopunctata]|uniref:Uncharacterized protein n=1 Tax=Henosepilachna vigintioctopunctata TaxID=420089 RepID=A0AAW1VG54_9CUCU